MSVDPLRAGDPDRLGGYWLAGRLGSGGQGVVYEAYDEAANRVAVKVLHAYLAGDPQLRRRFTREVRAAQRVASFCTAPVLGHDLDGERPYIVSQFVPGPSMRAAVTAPFTGDALHRLAVGMATALAAIHQAGVVHRDLKPENVLLGPDGPRVIDFGIARAAGLSMTSTGELTGTPLYMAPELFSGGRAEPSADVFAWGAMVCFAATARDAFGAPTTVATIHRLLTAHPDLTMLPSGLRDLVDLALSKEPSSRPTAQELLLALLGGSFAVDGSRAVGGSASLAAGARAASAVRPPAELAGEPALGHIAELVYGSLPPEGREVARQLMLRLVDVHDGTELPRQVTLGELPDAAAAEPVLAALTRASLLERGAETISVRKAALLRAWPRLHEWVDGDRDSLDRHRRLGEAARRWVAAGRHPEDLLRGTALHQALVWAADLPAHFTLNLAEKAYLEASRAQSVRQSRRRRLVITSLAGLLVVSLTAGAFAWQQSMLSDESGRQLAAERAQAGSRRVALQAEALRKSDPVRAMRLSLAAYRIADVPESRAAVFNSAGQQETRVFTDPVLTNNGRALSVDGSTLISAGGDRVTAYDVATGRVTGTFTGVGQGPFAAALGPDGDTLALFSGDRIVLWSVKKATKLGEGAHSSLASPSIRFSPAGRYLMVAGSGGTFDGLWDVATRKSLGFFGGTVNVIGPGDRFGMVSIGTDDQPLRLRSLPGGSPLGWTVPDRTAVLGFTPDGKHAVLHTGENLVLRNLATGKADRREFPETYPSVMFAADGSFMVVTSGNRVTVYRVRDAAMIARFTSPAPLAGPPRLSEDNRHLTLLDEAGQVTTYDLGRQSTPSLRLGEDVTTPQVGADGRTVYAMVSGAARAWTLPELKPVGEPFKLPADEDGPPITAVSPDGKVLASTDPTFPDGPLTLWDTGTRRKLATVPLPGPADVGDNKEDLAFSPDGRFVAVSYSVSSDYYNLGGVAVVEVARPYRSRVFTKVSGGELHFSGDSRTLTTGDGGGVNVIDVVAGKVLPRSQGPGTTARLWLSPDPTGVRAASPYGARGVVLWDARTWKPAGRVLRVGGDVIGAWFSPDGATVAVTHDYRVTLFDAASGRQLGAARVLSSSMHAAYTDAKPVLSFDAGGGVVRAIAADGTYRELLLDPGRVAPLVCERAGRGLSESEWREHVGQDFAFTQTC